MLKSQNWSQRRRARHDPPDSADAAIAACTRQVRSGAFAEASRSALLAHRLVRLEADYHELKKKRAYKEAMARHRAEAALEEARKVVASRNASRNPLPPVRSQDDIYREVREQHAALEAAVAAINRQRAAANTQISSAAVQNPPPDSC